MFGWSKKEKEHKAALLVEYAQYQKQMLEPLAGKSPEGHSVIILAAEISINTKSRMGLVLQSNWKSSARIVHAINQNGTLSKKQAQWTKAEWSQCKPRRFVIVKCVHGPPMIPIEIVEIDTAYRPKLTFEDWQYCYGKI